MLLIGSKHLYRAFGLSIASDLPLPELIPCDPNEKVDAEIIQEDLNRLWEQHARPSRSFVYLDHAVMFQVPGTAIFCIQDGRSILVSPRAGSDVDKIRLYILGTCMGILLMQKRILPLHGSAIAIDGKAYAFVGDSGAGKSTLATLLLRQGHQLLSDDLIAVAMSGDQLPMVSSSYPQQKLWQESMDHLGMCSAEYKPLFERETKFAVPVDSLFCRETLPLAGVVELMKCEEGEVRLQEVSGLDRFQLLLRHTYRSLVMQQSGLMEWHFGVLAALVNRIEVLQLERPLKDFTAYQVAEQILDHIHKEES